MTTDGFYEVSIDFMQVPDGAGGNPIPEILPECTNKTYARYMTINDPPWTPPPAPVGSTGWVIEYSAFVATTPVETGTGDAPAIVINDQTPGYGGPTALGCALHLFVTYLCPNGPVTPTTDFPDGTDEENFVNMAELTQNVSQLTQMDRIITMVGRDPDGDYTDLWPTIYTEAQAFLLANPDYILDMSFLEITDMSLIATLSELRKINLSHNLLGGVDLDVIADIPLTYLDLSYNLVGATQDRKFQPMLLNGLKYIDLSHNQLQEYYMFEASNAGGNWEMDYVDYSYNFLAAGACPYLQPKILKVTNNTYPTDTFWVTEGTFGEDLQMNTANFGDNWQDLELIDLSDTQLKYSLPASDPNTPDTHIEQLLTAIEASGHTESEAISLLVRFPKWETIDHDPYDRSEVYP